jgi:hypothetical protein
VSRIQRHGEEITIKLKAGREAGGFARFLEGAAEAIRLGHIKSTNPNPTISSDVAAMQLRQLADRIHGVNS